MKPKIKKNIGLVLHDIRHPVTNKKPDTKKNKTKKENRFSYKPFFLSLSILIILFGFYNLPFVSLDYRFNDGVVGDRDFETNYGFSDIKFSFSNLKLYFLTLRNVSKNIAKLNSDGINLVFNGGGLEFLEILRELESDFNKLDKIGADTGSIFVSSASITDSLDSFSDLSDLVSGIVDILDKPSGGRILLLFENHSEIRPSGGFVGSYGVVTFKNGNIVDIKTDDIYTPDRDTELLVVPPIQLQSITGNWGARDANWFFDFPTSAEKIAQFLEASNVYVNDNITFDGVISLNSNVVSDILEITGPIYIAERDLTVTSENLLLEIREDIDLQREDWEPGDNPKEILGFIAPILTEKLQSFNEYDREHLTASMLNRAGNKDLKFYFRDEALENLVKNIGIGGSVYEIKDDFFGDYLAVVNTNIAGGKSDIFVGQNIELFSEILRDGTIKNNLTITRRHFGSKEEHPWYRADNQNFTKIFTTPNAELISIQGVTPKEIEPVIDYEDSKYRVDNDLAGVENTRRLLADINTELYKESGKNVFGAWFITPSGEERSLILEYNAQSKSNILNNKSYTFVYEKQSGVESSLYYKVLAPDGFIWAETGGNLYSYKSDGIPGRLVLNLTLIAI